METKIEDKMCTCGCPESMHIDGEDHCAACVDCREFEEVESAEEKAEYNSYMEAKGMTEAEEHERKTLQATDIVFNSNNLN